MAETGALTAANLVLRFLLELAALAALAYWGFHTGKTVVADVVLGLGAPLVAAVVWGVFAAPSSARRLRGGALVAVQSAVSAAAAIALVAAGQPVLAIAFALVVAVNSVVLQVLGDEWPGARS